MRSHRSSRLAPSHRSILQRSRRLSPEARALRALAAGTLAGAIGSPFIARADEANAPSTATNNASARLEQLGGNQNVGQGPRVSIVAPSYSDLVRGDTAIVIAVEASGSPTKSVQLFVDGVSASGGGAIPFENLPSAQFNWQTSKFRDGQHQLSVRVTDANGFIGQADTQVYINNSGQTTISAPKLNWMNVHDGDLLHGQADLQLQAGSGFGVKYIVITVNSIANPDRLPPLRASLINRAPYVYSLDTMRLPDGVYVLKARGYDVLQNEGETKQVTFGVSNNGLNPTVIERLSEVMSKQKPEQDASTAQLPVASSTRNVARASVLTTQIHPEARRTPSQNAVADQNAAKNIATKNVVQKSVVKNVGHTSKAVKASTITVQKSQLRVATTKTVAPKTSTPMRVASAPVAITHSRSVDAAQLILPRPSLTAANLATSVEPSLQTSTKVSVFADDTMFRAKISLPVLRESRNNIGTVVSSTRWAQAPRISSIANAATTAPSLTMAVASPGVGSIAPVAKSTTVAAGPVSALPLSPEMRQSRSLSSVLPAKSASSPEMRKSRPILGVVPTKVAAPRVDVSTTVGNRKSSTVATPERLAMAPDTRRGTVPFGAATTLDTTHQNATTRAIGAAQQSAPLHMTTAVLSATDARIAGSAMHAVRGNDQSRGVRQLISLPSTLGTPSRSNTNTPRTNPAITMSPATVAALGTRGAAGTLPALHVVAKGETLRSVAARYGLPVETLASVNALPEKAVLKTGEKLNLPRALNFRFSGENKSSDIGAIMVGETSVAPFRFLFEQQGGTIRWDEAHQRITATNGTNQVTLSIGSREATVNDRKVMMDLAAFLLSGRTMVPIRFFEKALQAQVQWEPSTGRIYISMSNG